MADRGRVKHTAEIAAADLANLLRREPLLHHLFHLRAFLRRRGPRRDRDHAGHRRVRQIHSFLQTRWSRRQIRLVHRVCRRARRREQAA